LKVGDDCEAFVDDPGDVRLYRRVDQPVEFAVQARERAMTVS
jgi:hypothetical protein